MCLTHGLAIPNQEEPGCAMVSIPLISIPSYMFLNTYFGYIYMYLYIAASVAHW